MAGPYFNICSPREVGLARYVVGRLGRSDWLDTQWVHGTAPLDLDRDIVEDANDFPPALMAEASLVSLALRVGAVNSVPDMFLSVRTFAFYPAVARERLIELLSAKGFQERHFVVGERDRIEREPAAKEARAMLFNSLHALPTTPLVSELFWEMCDEDPSRAAKLLSESPSTASSVFARRACPQHQTPGRTRAGCQGDELLGGLRQRSARSGAVAGADCARPSVLRRPTVSRDSGRTRDLREMQPRNQEKAVGA